MEGDQIRVQGKVCHLPVVFAKGALGKQARAPPHSSHDQSVPRLRDRVRGLHIASRQGPEVRPQPGQGSGYHPLVPTLSQEWQPGEVQQDVLLYLVQGHHFQADEGAAECVRLQHAAVIGIPGIPGIPFECSLVHGQMVHGSMAWPHEALQRRQHRQNSHEA